jgi:hypothetical protein
MKLARTRTRGEGGLALLIIVLLIIGGIVWWLYAARQNAEKNMRVFAAEATRHVAVVFDESFLNSHLSLQGQGQTLPS